MTLFINETGLAAQVFNGMNGITGSAFLTLFLIVMLMLLIAFLFRIPIEFTAILVLPMLLVFAAFYGEFLAVVGVFLIYLGIILGKNFFFRS